MLIYPVDSVIHALNNPGQVSSHALRTLVLQNTGEGWFSVKKKVNYCGDFFPIMFLLFKNSYMVPGTRFSKLPVITGPVKLFCFPYQMRASKVLKNCTLKSLAKETKWTVLKVRTHHTFLEALISKYFIGPGLSRNGPQVWKLITGRTEPQFSRGVS